MFLESRPKFITLSIKSLFYPYLASSPFFTPILVSSPFFTPILVSSPFFTPMGVKKGLDSNIATSNSSCYIKTSTPDFKKTAWVSFTCALFSDVNLSKLFLSALSVSHTHVSEVTSVFFYCKSYNNYSYINFRTFSQKTSKVFECIL
ncbi:hypothetical protein CDIK_3990 [Cucumispora dikerogammari]|nr:hypothetical protein CDIK_3990 [Cucumispora dikerogammari]